MSKGVKSKPLSRRKFWKPLSPVGFAGTPIRRAKLGGKFRVFWENFRDFWGIFGFNHD